MIKEWRFCIFRNLGKLINGQKVAYGSINKIKFQIVESLIQNDLGVDWWAFFIPLGWIWLSMFV